MQALAGAAHVVVGGDHLGILHDAAVGAGAVNLDQVLVNDAAGADIEVSHFGVAHLPVGQAYVLAASQKLRVGVLGVELIEEGRGRLIDDVALGMVADAPSVEDH